MLKLIIRYILNLALVLTFFEPSLNGTLAGGRPNSISGGQNAFAGVVNPANAVFIEDRFDVGCFILHQKAFLDNRDNNPFFPPGKINQAYKTSLITTADIAIHKRFKIKETVFSLSFASYTTPGYVKVRTKKPFLITGTTPIHIKNKSQVFSTIFSLKLNKQHSIGFSLDYFYLSHLRNGFQRSDNVLRSVSPGHVTNNGLDHSSGLGLTLGWRWNMTKRLTFGLVFIKKAYAGQFRKYRGFEPHHARNYIPRMIGGGFTYFFTKKLAGRLEVIWTNFGDLPNANNSVLANGEINRNKRGSSKSPGPGLQDATFINMGLGYKLSTKLSLGAGYSHRIKLKRKSPLIISRSYMRQTTYHLLSLGANFKHQKHEFFLTFSHGFQNRETGLMPIIIGGGKFVSKRSFNSLSLAWGYLF